MSTSRIALVTGANQGLGRALAAGLAARMRAEDTVLLTGRDAGRVAAAAEEIRRSPKVVARVEDRVLDVSRPEAVAALAEELRGRHSGADVVISNAAARLRPDVSQAAQADEFIDVSNGGTHAVLRSFPQVLRPGGRLLVVASSLGTLGRLPESLHPMFDGATLDQVEHVVESWRSSIHRGVARETGWPLWLNLPSKVAQVAAVRAVAADRRGQDLANDIMIASVCPGMVDTAASRPWFTDYSAAQSPKQAAEAVLDLALATSADPALYGELVRFGEVLPWRGGTRPTEQEGLLIP
ncbi:SDR family NAD(P)-dependent oxidoreductase [Streptomyces sp. NRRL F-5126]|uniref:SDR family NAD(P)-dependent oxidoreductase n=1 Tax=Streptomyces sp. NRRL F-5126 TaxID=1463857 RepID=UPI0004C68512|nr:SDR family NAD(P)-dependent oxidoreductase [Streptomyces sp. NRRL F-5126]